MSKEGSPVKETQDMGGGWCPCCDQAQRRSHGLRRPRVCVEFLDPRYSEAEISSLVLLLAMLAPMH